ncbi:MAG TPA: FAD-dependent oxidoreductase [Ktedonobacterales bacterium]|nr:FAD-dependent oxidoreductase [Ktedonobacterales bacterium]
MERLGDPARPLRITIIGAGPAGLYAADTLLKKRDIALTIDIFNRFPTPFGLVRDGVAPDHQSIKSVIRVFEKVLADPRVRFFGNVTYGADIHHADLLRYYDQVIYAVGAQADRRMNIAGEDLPNSFAATAFVGWYNGHPDFQDLPIDLSCARAVVVGNGNVAMDVARILVTPTEALERTDIADVALEKLRQSAIREVVILGRRGAAQASFTTPEIKELGKIPGVDVVVDPRNVALDPASLESLEHDRAAVANLECLHAYAAQSGHSAARRIVLRFLASPREIVAMNGGIAAVRIEDNELIATATGDLRARGTGVYENIEAGLVLRSIGYRSLPIEGVPFNDESATFNHRDGRIIATGTGLSQPGEYVVGWAKRGPSGLIGNNKPDAVATVESMMADLPTLQGIGDEHRDPARIETYLRERGIDFVTYQDWMKLDQYEAARGAGCGRPRIKLTSVPEMMAVIHARR